VISPIKKGIAVWIFGSLTFLAVLHTFDAFLSITSRTEISLLQLYPFDTLKHMDAVTYFWASLSSAFLLFGITCIIAFQNAVEAFINRLFTESELEGQDIESMPVSTFDMINDSLTSTRIDLQTVKNDLISVKDSLDTVKTEMRCFRSELEKFNINYKRKCPSCGRETLPDFNLCPYCGEKLSIRAYIKRETPLAFKE